MSILGAQFPTKCARIWALPGWTPLSIEPIGICGRVGGAPKNARWFPLSTARGRIWARAGRSPRQRQLEKLQIVNFLTIVQVAQFWEKNFLNFCSIFYLTIFRKDGIMEVCGRPAARGAITFLKEIPAKLALKISRAKLHDCEVSFQV